MTIIDYLRSKVDYYVGDNTLYSIVLDRGYNSSQRAEDLTFTERELLRADLLMYGVTIYGGSIKRGDFSRTQGKVDVDALKREANEIYKKYGDAKYNSLIDNSITHRWIEEYE